ncbi:MAG: hypothetical protein ACM3QZ_11595 [Solirubrobacterales bacterium]
MNGIRLSTLLTLQNHGWLQLNENILDQLNVGEGTRFEASVEPDGTLILKPLVMTPQLQTFEDYREHLNAAWRQSLFRQDPCSENEEMWGLH